MSVVQSSKGKPQLLHQGFRYRQANKSQVTWRCVRNNCAGRVTFDNTECINLTDHNHAPNPDEITSAKFKSKVNERAAVSSEAPRKIIHEMLLDVDPGDASSISSYTTAQRSIARKRKKNDIPLPTPSSFESIVIPEQLKLTNTGDQFMLYDNEQNDNRIIIFSSMADLNRLSNSEHWHADGTFKVSLNNQCIAQQYIIQTHNFIIGCTKSLLSVILNSWVLSWTIKTIYICISSCQIRTNL